MTSILFGEYLQKETSYRQPQAWLGNCEGSPTISRNCMNFGPQLAKNSTFTFAHHP